MQQARTFVLVVSLVALVYGALGYALLPQAAFEGDLTRMAMLPEQLFGWRRPQPPLQPGELQQASMADADVLVIGDSFSMPRVWQVALWQKGLRVRTEHWDNFRAVCQDLPAFLVSKGFKGRHIVLQVVERNLGRVLGDSLSCAVTQYRSKHQVDEAPFVSASFIDRQHAHRNGRMSVGIRTRAHGFWYERLAEDKGFESWPVTSDVRIARVANGCARFSHSACQDALFLTEDAREDLAPELVGQMAAVASRLNAWSVTWAVVPNKSTVYLHPGKRFWQIAQAQLKAPDLLGMTQRALAGGQVDLYLGNNTHFSTEGYQLMGAVVRDALLGPR